MANSMSQYRQNGVDYIIDDPTTAQVFVETAAYTAGTYVKHQGNMYRFTTDHEAGAWNASEVTQVTLGQEVSDLKSALSESGIFDNLFVANSSNLKRVTASGGSVGQNSYIFNTDGSITSRTDFAQNGRIYLEDRTKVLLPGTYIVSARFVFTDERPEGSRRINVGLGRVENKYVTIAAKTEPFGFVNIDNTAKEGYLAYTATITQEQPLAIFINAESDHLYTSRIYDLSIVMKEQAENGIKYLLNSRNDDFYIFCMNGGYPVIRYNQRDILFPGTKMYILDNVHGRRTIEYTTIIEQLGEYAVQEDAGLRISLPSTHVFGYDLTDDKFVIRSYTYNSWHQFVPLAYTYYTIVIFKDILINKAILDLLSTDLNTAVQNLNTAVQNLNTAVQNQERMCYTTSTSRHSWKAGDKGGMIVTIQGLINFRFSANPASDNWEDVVADDLKNYIEIDGNNATITFPRYSYGLFYSTEDKKIHMVNIATAGKLPIGYINLWTISYGYPISGLLFEEYINRNVMDMLAVQVNSNTILTQTFNSSFHTGATNFDVKCKEFSYLMFGDTSGENVAPVDFEPFLFFTDPHLVEFTGWEKRCYEYISQIQKYYNSTPTDFCICGGDWLGNSDLPDTACFKLGYIDGFMHSMFDNCYMIMGNHDTNYQGKKDAESATWTTKNSVQCRENLWYRGKRAYFTFEGRNTKFYCFDTDTEAVNMNTYDNYGWNQAVWFAKGLLSETAKHIAIVAHIFYYNYANKAVQPLSNQLLLIAEAYNSRASVIVNGETFDYSAATGRVEFFLAGHSHLDDNGIYHGVPFIVTTNVRHNQNLGPSFDLCFVDYEERIFKAIRVGDGENRFVSLDTGELIVE